MKILMFMVSCRRLRLNAYGIIPALEFKVAMEESARVKKLLITEDQGLKLDKVHIGMLGTAKKLRTSMENSSSMFDKEKAQERLSKLSGGVVVFKVGGASEAQVGERKDRVIDALNATKATVEEGILLGGSVALLYSSRVLNYLQTANNDQKRGVEIIQNALKAPTFIISENAGVNGDFVVGKLLDQDNVNLGYDASKGMFQISTHEGTQNSLCHLSLLTFCLSHMTYGYFCCCVGKWHLIPETRCF
ncbi:hypothetical protein MKW92_032730 [Papaver armeniacum]|nr:hypothetical protein MKW92_032730 [Papaver armeniacum]